MNMKEMIATRHSCRAYKNEAVDEKTIESLKHFLAEAKPLFPELEVRYEFLGLDDMMPIANYHAPHYIVVYAKKHPLAKVNAGFLFQQFDLYAQSLGLGVCWLGITGPEEDLRKDFFATHPDYEYVISLSFGYQEGDGGPAHFHGRKALEEISDSLDERLEPARLAPSAKNGQPWYFLHKEDGYDVYKDDNPTLTRWQEVDIGIALAHLYVYHPATFEAFTREEPKELEKRVYITSIRF